MRDIYKYETEHEFIPFEVFSEKIKGESVSGKILVLDMGLIKNKESFIKLAGENNIEVDFVKRPLYAIFDFSENSDSYSRFQELWAAEVSGK